MPNRLLKEGICTSDAINSLPSDSEVLFYRLLVVSDDYGRMDGRIQIVKSQCFPLKDSFTTKKIESSLDDLKKAGLITTYNVDDKPFFFINKWDQRQRSKSKYPDPLTADCAQPADDMQQDAETCGLGLGKGLGLGLGSGKGMGKGVDLACPHDKLINLYYEHLPDNPKIVKLESTRKVKLTEVWVYASKGLGKIFQYKTVEEGLKQWECFFKICGQSDFLTGKSPPRNENGKPFIADIDFICNKKNLLKILENKYH